MKVRLGLAGLTTLLLLTACGGGEAASEPPGSEDSAPTPAATADTGDTGESAARTGEVTELTAVIPFPSGAVFYPLFVAQERGYLEQEGLSLQVEAVDGSGAVLQQVLAGQAQVGLPSPGPFMSAVQEGATLVSVYTLFQSNVFALVTPQGSEVTGLEDLAGQTIGVGTIEGGETKFVRALLSEAADLSEGDYELLAVGDGGSALTGLEGGDIVAYAASFADVAIMNLRGMELENLVPGDFQSFFDSLVVMDGAFAEENPEMVAGLGRALAKATVWGLDNPDGVLDITGEYYPEENEDREFTAALLTETQALFALPDAADGQWGYAVPDAVERYMNFLVEQGELAEPVDTAIFVNDYVEQYNDFDPAEL